MSSENPVVEHIPYQGRRLQANEIRLLTIHPGSPDQQLQCDFKVYAYEAAPPYDALSYVWGNKMPRQEITIGSQRCSVTLSLYDALTTLRSRLDQAHSGSAHPLWVDAVCINQQDNDEKDEQIRNMSKVYSRAKKVLIFLGKRGDVFMESLQSLAATVCAFREGSPDLSIDWTVFIKDTNEVFSAPWFYRVWVLQEAALAQEPVLICGKLSVPFDNIVGASDVVFRHVHQIIAASRAGLGFDSSWLRPSNMFVQTRKKSDNPGITPVQAFMNNVANARTSRCFDPRDHVFGLFGLAASDKLDLAALGLSYEQSPQVVFTRITQYFMNSFKPPVQALVAMNHEGDIGTEGAWPGWQVKLIDLPSWVPDFHLPPTARFQEHLYRSGGPVSLHSGIGLFEVSDTTLHSRGMLVGYIDLQFDIISNIKRWPQIEELFSVLDPEVERRGGTRLYGDQAQRMEVYRRAVPADSVYDQSTNTYKRIDQIYGNDPTSFLNFSFGIGLSNADEYLAEKAKYSWEACRILNIWFVLLSSGHVGIGSPRLTSGDVVVVFPGVSMPVALRPRSSSSSYQWLGPIYIHGIMDGEMMSNVESNPDLLTTFNID